MESATSAAMKKALAAWAVGASVFGSMPQMVSAQSLPPGVKPGMSAAELQSSGLALHRVPRPERMGNGARGLWQQSLPGPDGLIFEVTYFVRGSVVDRIDLSLLAAPDGTGSAFERIVGELRAALGAELRSQQSSGNAISETASWVGEDQNVVAYRIGPIGAEKIRVVYKRRESRNADAL